LIRRGRRLRWQTHKSADQPIRIEEIEAYLQRHADVFNGATDSSHLEDERIALVLESNLSIERDEPRHLARCKECRIVLTELGRAFAP
jgi:hypothetical protein